MKHLEEGNVEDLDKEKARELLGDVLDVIRFRDMQLCTFIKFVAPENILPDSTKISIIIGINEKSISIEEIHVHRFAQIEPGSWGHIRSQSGISFTVSSPALLTGVCLYLPKDDGETSGPLEILEEDKIVLTQIVTLKYQHGMKYRNEPLSTQIRLQQGKVYSVRHIFKGQNTYYGRVPIAKSYGHHHDITIEFMNLKHGVLNSGTDLEKGQIPGLTVQVKNK